MTAPPIEKRPAGRPPKISNRARWGLYVNAEHRRRGEARAAEQQDGDFTDVVRALMADYAAGRVTPSAEGRAEVGQ